MRFSDIPQFTRPGQWECHFGPKELIGFIDDQVAHGLDLNPDFQRGHVWSEDKQRAYIEFVLRGGVSGRVIYLNNPGWWNDVKRGGYADFVLVDGKQRIQAWRKFLANELMAFGYLHRDFTDRPRVQHEMRVNINTLPTKADVLQWYLDLNEGGVVHAESEIQRVRRLLDAERRLADKR